VITYDQIEFRPAERAQEQAVGLVHRHRSPALGALVINLPAIGNIVSHGSRLLHSFAAIVAEDRFRQIFRTAFLALDGL